MGDASRGTGGAADVYAGDLTARAAAESGTGAYVFRIEADAACNVLDRVAGLFNIADTAPSRASLERETDTLKMAVVIQLPSANMAQMIRRKLEQLTCVTTVEVSLGNLENSE